MWRFVPLAYGLDLRVLDQVVKLPQPRLLRDSGGERTTGKFKVAQPDTCLFRPAFRIFAFELHTPFPIKGVLRWGESPWAPRSFSRPGSWDGRWEDSRSRQLNPRSSAYPLRFSVGCSASDDSDHDGRHDERTPPHEFAGHLATHDGMRETVTND